MVEIAGRLAAVDDRYADWAAEVGVPVGSVKTPAEKDDLIAELDALVSLLYGLTEDQVEHVFATFHRGWNYEARLDAVLTHYRAVEGQGMTQLPDFATNHSPSDAATTVADKVNELFRLLRENKVEAPPIAIATAYINPAGFALLADELETAPRVRLLLGAEPEAESVRAITSGDSDQDARRDAAIQHHQAWLEAERDTMGFARMPDRRGEADGRVAAQRRPERRRPRSRSVATPAASFTARRTSSRTRAAQAAIAGSSNMTYAGLAHNAELNLGTGGGTQLGRQGAASGSSTSGR